MFVESFVVIELGVLKNSFLEPSNVVHRFLNPSFVFPEARDRHPDLHFHFFSHSSFLFQSLFGEQRRSLGNHHHTGSERREKSLGGPGRGDRESCKAKKRKREIDMLAGGATCNRATGTYDIGSISSSSPRSVRWDLGEANRSVQEEEKVPH